MKNNHPPVNSVKERDIDFLLLEEFNVNNLFCQWFIDKLNLPTFDSLEGAWRSVSSDGLGETDILFAYISDGLKIGMLIENKVNASFQPEQFERYLIRAERLMAREKFNKVFCTLVAPNAYCNQQTKFEWISYEDIAEWFGNQNTPRDTFKQMILKIAINKFTTARTLSDFCTDYWRFFDDHKIMRLGYRQPSKSTASHHAQFYPKKLSKFTVYHLFEMGVISISVKKRHLKKEEINLFLSFDEFNPKETKGKIGFRFQVPKINTTEPTEREVIDNILSFIDKKVNLIETKIRNCSV